MREWLARLIDVRRGERLTVVASGFYFFFILYGYFLLRPAREELGVESGMDAVRALFFGTLVVTLAANPVFGWVVARFRRRVFMPLVMRFFMVNLVGFFALLTMFGEAVGLWSGYAYFVWLSVFNMFMVMMFWAFMSDHFTLAQSKRVYPVIAIGGTLGALAGSYTAWEIAGVVGTPALLVIAVVFLELGVRSAGFVDRRPSVAGGWDPAMGCVHCGYEVGGLPTDVCPECGLEWRGPAGGASPRTPIGGSAWAGFGAAARSPYLLGICGFILLMAVLQTLVYFAQLEIVSRLSDDTDRRTGLFAYVNMITQLATLFAQLFITASLIRAIGVGRTLAVVPLVIGAGFAALAFIPAAAPAVAYKAIVALEAGFKALSRGVSRPTRETLFTVVPREDRYKAKALIDTFVYRFGDVVGLGVDAVLRASTPALAALAFVAAPVAVLWGGLGLWLGSEQRRRAERGDGAAPSTLDTEPRAVAAAGV